MTSSRAASTPIIAARRGCSATWRAWTRSCTPWTAKSRASRRAPSSSRRGSKAIGRATTRWSTSSTRVWPISRGSTRTCQCTRARAVCRHDIRTREEHASRACWCPACPLTWHAVIRAELTSSNRAPRVAAPSMTGRLGSAGTAGGGVLRAAGGTAPLTMQ
eukprot:25188-Prymnesium_polylepis.1